LVLADELEELIAVTGLAYDLKVGALEQARETFAQQHVVISDNDAPGGGDRLRSHDRFNLTPLPASRYVEIPAAGIRRGALVGYPRKTR